MAVADPLPGKAATFAAEHGIPRSYTGAEEMLQNEQLDFVDIATRPNNKITNITGNRFEDLNVKLVPRICASTPPGKLVNAKATGSAVPVTCPTLKWGWNGGDVPEPPAIAIRSFVRRKRAHAVIPYRTLYPELYQGPSRRDTVSSGSLDS